MRKEKYIRFLFILSFIFIIGNVCALSTDLKENYAPSETAVVKISGNVLDVITKEQVEFKRVNVKLPLKYDIQKLGDGNYYIWFVTPETQESNITLIIKNVSTIISGNPEKTTLRQNFSVSGEKSYHIEPGFVLAKENFDISIISSLDDNLYIEIDYPYEQRFLVKPGANTLTLPISAIPSTEFLLLKIGKYTFPAYIVRNSTAIIKNKYIDVLPYRIQSVKLIGDEDVYYQFVIRNIGRNTLENIYVQYNNEIFSLEPDKNISLKINESATYNLKLKYAGKEINDVVYVKSGDNVSFAMPVNVIFVKNISEYNRSNANTSNGNSTGLYSCLELLGEICLPDESCSGESAASSDGICCTGQCTIPEQGSKSWIGYLIAGIVILSLIVIYYKYKNVKSGKNLIEKSLDNSEKVKRMP